MIIYTFSNHFLLEPSQKSASKNMKIFHNCPLKSKNMIFSTKRPLKFNSVHINQQNQAQLQNLEIKKSCIGRIFEFLIFSRFCCFLVQKMAKFEKISFVKFRVLNFKNEKKKIKILASTSFCIILKSVSKQNIMSNEQFLREL